MPEDVEISIKEKPFGPKAKPPKKSPHPKKSGQRNRKAKLSKSEIRAMIAPGMASLKRQSAKKVAKFQQRKKISPAAFQIARTMANPVAYKPIPNGSAASAELIATGAPFDSQSVDWGRTTQTNQFYPPLGQSVVVLLRDFLCFMILYLANSAALTWEYDWLFSDGTGGVTGDYSFTAADSDEDLEVCYALSNANAQWSPHSSFLAAGKSVQSLRYIWVDVGQIAITLDGAVPTGQSITLTIYQWSKGSDFKKGSHAITAGGTSYTYNVMQPGYYRVQIEAVTYSGQLSVASSGNDQVWAHLPFPEYDKYQSVFTDVGVLSGSVLYSNETPEQNIGGTIFAANGKEGTFWLDTAPGGTSSVAKMANYVKLPGKDGCYMFLKTRAATDLDLQGGLQQDSDGTGSVALATFDIQTTHPWMIMAFQAPGNIGATSSYSAQITTVTYCAGICYTTDAKIIGQDLPPLNKDDYEDALAMMRFLPNITHNGTHLKDIGKWLLGAAGKVGKFAIDKGNFVLNTAKSIYSGYEMGGPAGAAVAAAAQVPSVLTEFGVM